MTAPSARMTIGGVHPSGLYRTPAAAETQPGEIAIVLGTTISGLPVVITTTSLEWLDDLAGAIQVARARGIVQAGITP